MLFLVYLASRTLLVTITLDKESHVSKKKAPAAERWHRKNPERTEPHRRSSGAVPPKASERPRRTSDDRDDDMDDNQYGYYGQGRRAGDHVVEEYIRSRRQQMGYGDQWGQSPLYRYRGGRGDGAIDQMMRMYLDLMNCVVSMVSAGPLARPSYAYYPEHYQASELHRHHRVTHVSIETITTVKSPSLERRYVTTKLDLEAPRHAHLYVEPLETMDDDDADPIDKVSITMKGHRPVLQLTIPENQPNGTYSGEICDADTREVYGTAVVRIELVL